MADIDRAQAFYTRLFELDVMMRDGRMAALAVPGRQVLLLFQTGMSGEPTGTPFGLIPAHGSRGIQHLCFAIEREDVSLWEARLGEAGIEIESRLEWPQGTISLYFRDLDGHSVELSTPFLWPNDHV